jgi:hypothetical protein
MVEARLAERQRVAAVEVGRHQHQLALKLAEIVAAAGGASMPHLASSGACEQAGGRARPRRSSVAARPAEGVAQRRLRHQPRHGRRCAYSASAGG